MTATDPTDSRALAGTSVLSARRFMPDCGPESPWDCPSDLNDSRGGEADPHATKQAQESKSSTVATRDKLEGAGRQGGTNRVSGFLDKTKLPV